MTSLVSFGETRLIGHTRAVAFGQAMPPHQNPGERFRRYREGNSRQFALFCPCGALGPLTAGLCSPVTGSGVIPSGSLLLAELWAEQHPGVPVQLQISLSAQLDLPFEGREVSRAFAWIGAESLREL